MGDPIGAERTSALRVLCIALHQAAGVLSVHRIVADKEFDRLAKLDTSEIVQALRNINVVLTGSTR